MSPTPNWNKKNDLEPVSSRPSLLDLVVARTYKLIPEKKALINKISLIPARTSRNQKRKSEARNREA